MSKWVKRFLSVLLACLLIGGGLTAGTVPAGATTGGTSGDWKYELNYGNAWITGYTGSSSSLNIPSGLDGYLVTGIQSYAFYGKKDIVSVTIPNSITLIGNNAFNGCSSLAYITVPDTLVHIGSRAFS